MSQLLLMLVDDSAEMGMIVAFLGKRAGWEVLACPDAETAWIALARHRPDLVLLDVNLPGLSGPDWLRRVRSAPEIADLPVALYTHWGLVNDLAAGLEAGADFVFDKDLATRPVDWQQRLMEISAGALSLRAGRHVGVDWPAIDAAPTIEYSGAGRRLTAVRVAGLNHALHLALLRLMPPELMRLVLRRSLARIFTPRILPKEWETWIAFDGCGLELERLPPSLDPVTLLYLSASLLEQMGRLLGAEANSALRDALTAAVPGLSEFLAGS
jgi:CheY-like chemotaxis protein